MASPFPIKEPKNPNDLIKPAVQGTKSVLNAALKVGVLKVVVTSSIAAVYCSSNIQKVLNEEDWADPTTIATYSKSKFFAE